MENLIIFIVFVGALVYLGRRVYDNFQTKNGCAKGCGGSCSKIDVEKIIKASESRQPEATIS